MVIFSGTCDKFAANIITKEKILIINSAIEFPAIPFTKTVKGNSTHAWKNKLAANQAIRFFSCCSTHFIQ